MADKRELLTAAQLDEMTPNERMDAFEQRVITNLDDLPEEFRDQVTNTAGRLGEERRTPTEA